MSFGRLVAFAVASSFAAGAGSYYFLGDTPLAQAAAIIAKPLTAYGRCSGNVRIQCVVDGDTIWSAGTKIRVADIDTPEISEPKCSAERALGERATARMLELINAGPFEIRSWEDRDEDKYGRKLRVLIRDGRSLGDILVSEGLARTWTGRRQPWC